MKASFLKADGISLAFVTAVCGQRTSNAGKTARGGIGGLNAR
jgi:hypothetical protein